MTKPPVTQYTIVILPEADGRFSIVVPALPGCVTWGKSIEAAIANAKEAVAGHVAALADNGYEAPIEQGAPYVTAIAIDIQEACGSAA